MRRGASAADGADAEAATPLMNRARLDRRPNRRGPPNRANLLNTDAVDARPSRRVWLIPAIIAGVAAVWWGGHEAAPHLATLVEDARALGADIEQFGPQEGLFYPATVLTEVTQEMVIAQQETFGPVAPVMKVGSVAEAIEIANSSELGLIASLWTRDLATAWRVGEALQHGTVNINETSNYWDQLAPFGGTGNSGVGRELSQWFLVAFTVRKMRCRKLFHCGRSASARGRKFWHQSLRRKPP